MTNRELSNVITNFTGFQENFFRRREADKREAAGEVIESKKGLGITLEQMWANQEQLRDEIEIEITFEESRHKELEARYS